MSLLSTPTGVAVIDTRNRPGTITLPLTNQIVNRYIQFKDLYGAFGRSSLTISTQAGEAFEDGTTSKVFSDPFTFLSLYAASTTRWAQLGGTQTIQQTMSSLIVSSLTLGSGYGWLQMPPIQTVALSTNTITADTIITNSTTSAYISAQVLYVSSILGVTIGGGSGDVTRANLTSTVAGLGTAGYLSTGGAGGGDVTRANLTSTVQGLATAGYLSSVSGGTGFVSSLTVNALTIGSGSGWLQLPPIQTIYASTTITQAQALYSLSSYFGTMSTATTLEFYGLFGNYNNTVLAEVSTGAGTQEFLVFKGSSASDRVRVQTTGTFVVETGVSARLWNDNTTATLSNATPAFAINTSSNVGIQIAPGSIGATLDVGGTARAFTVSSQQIFTSSLTGITLSSQQVFASSLIGVSLSTNVGAISSLFVNALQIGDGTGWISMGPIQSPALSTIQLNAQTTTTILTSTLALQVSSINGQAYWAPELSTVQGLGTAGYVSTLSLVSTTNFVGRSFSSFSTALTFSFFTSSLVASTITTSSLTVNSLTIGTGTGWINLGPLQTVAISSIQANVNDAYLNNVFVGTQSTINDIMFYGLFGNYNNTVLAEVSTGAGTQELLVFKGSSSSDRVRVQTTGTFVVETGVSARLFNSNTTQTLSNATPAFVINTNSNVGIQTASPQATLDVAGIGRFQQVSTLALQISSINGSVYTPGGGSGSSGPVPYISAFTVSTSYLEVSTVSSHAVFAYGVIATQFFNTSAEPMNLTSLNDQNLTAGASTILNTSALYASSSNDMRFVSLSNVYVDAPEVVASNLYVHNTVSTYSLVVYGPSTMTVQGVAYFENLVSSATLLTGSLAIFDSTTGDPGYITYNNGAFDLNGAAILDGTVLTSTIEGLGTLGYISTQSGGGGGGGGPIEYFSSPMKIGSNSTLSQLGFYGLFGDYNSAVVAEQSSGPGISELLVFKGSSFNDSIRLATMGNIRFEPERAAATFPDIPALATPTMILQSNLVGIATASPGTTLDVAGIGRFQEVSTITLRTNTIYTNTLNITITMI